MTKIKKRLDLCLSSKNTFPELRQTLILIKEKRVLKGSHATHPWHGCQAEKDAVLKIIPTLEFPFLE
jgi:hypothetical protein